MQGSHHRVGISELILERANDGVCSRTERCHIEAAQSIDCFIDHPLIWIAQCCLDHIDMQQQQILRKSCKNAQAFDAYII